MFVFSYLSINNCIFSEKKAFATPMPKEEQDKLGNDWVLTQYLASGIKIKTKSSVTSQARNIISEIMDYVMPPGSNIGDIIYDEKYPPLADIIQNESLTGYIFDKVYMFQVILKR